MAPTPPNPNDTTLIKNSGNPSDTQLITDVPRSSSTSTFKIFMMSAAALIAIAAVVTVYFLFIDERKPAETEPATALNASDALQDVPSAEETAFPQAVNPDDAPRAITKAESRQSSGGTVWHEGRNVLRGTVNLDGIKYGFTVTIDYSEATGRVSAATYEADGYAKASPLKLATISADGTTINLVGHNSGSETTISARAPLGSSTFIGSMTRGSHTGTCTMTLQ